MGKFHVNDRIEFRFVTRTLTDDYHVFGMEGRRDVVWGVKENRLPDEDEFAPLRKAGDIDPELGPCAVLFEHGKKIYLVVSGMNRGEKDRAGRVKRFSFCQIFDRADKAKAYAAFSRIITSFPDAEAKMRELIREVPVVIEDWQGNEKPSEEIEFRQQEFMDWLQEKQPENADLKIRLKTGYRLKWMEETSPDIMRERIDGLETSSKKWLFAVALIALLALAIGVLMSMNRKQQPQGNDEASNDAPGVEQTSETPEAPKVSGDNQPQVKEGDSSGDVPGAEPTKGTSDPTKERDSEQSEDVSGLLSGDNTSDRTFAGSLSKDIVSNDDISSDITINGFSDGGNAQ